MYAIDPGSPGHVSLEHPPSGDYPGLPIGWHFDIQRQRLRAVPDRRPSSHAILAFDLTRGSVMSLGGKGPVGCLSRRLPPAGHTPVAMLRQGSPREIRISKSRSGMRALTTFA